MIAFPKIITVGHGSGHDFNNLSDAALTALPGDTILISEGNYAGGENISDLHGTEIEPIVIMSKFGAYVIFEGGSNAVHFVNISYLTVKGLKFTGQTGNGINIDDGGDYSTPTRHIIFEDCEWLEMDANGNNDELKMSGVDDFIIRNCRFYNGSAGGSLIDMVGCHNGIVEECHFENGGSNSIQMKGGTEYITVRRNNFLNGGLRTLNIGGSTGSDYFRPLDAKFESARIDVYSNTISGSQAAIAFVGTVESIVINNTIYIPEKWAVRILQENTNEGIIACSNNEFSNNIVYIDDRASVFTFNIGPDTDSGSFIFKSNLWYNWKNPDWANPNIPSPEENGIMAKDPLFEFESFYLKEGSPAIGAGYDAGIEFDNKRKPFASPPSIGAIEGAVETMINTNEELWDVKIFPLPTEGKIHINIPSQIGYVNIHLFDLSGNQVLADYHFSQKEPIDVSKINNGIYMLRISNSKINISKLIIIKK